MRNISTLWLQKERDWDVLMFLALLCLFAMAYLTHDMNFAYGTGTLTRALYVDEGFYSDAAQNFVKLGQWGMAHDSRHWPGSPMTAILQSAAFSVFGVSMEVARMLSVLLTILGAWALYSIAKTRFHPGVSMLLVFASISTMTYFAIARAAVTDPMAMVMFLLAVWVFTCMENRRAAISLSLVFAFLSFFSKMYFIFAFATMITLWLGELLLPMASGKKINRGLVIRLGLSLLLIVLGYIAYRVYFSVEINNFLAINSNKTPVLEWAPLLESMQISFVWIPRTTQSAVILITLLLTITYVVSGFIRSRFSASPVQKNSLRDALSKISRAEWAMGIFLVSGLLTIGSFKHIKTHYHFFSIIPFAFLAIAMLYHILPRKLAAYVSVVVLLAHMAYQLPAYREWLSRPQPRSIDTLSRNIVSQLHEEYPQGLIPVIGEYSAQLALFSERIVSIDAKWVPRAELCERLNYWQPPYHVNVVWHESYSRKMIEKIDTCPSVQVKEETVYYRSLPLKNDYIAVTRLYYEDENERKPFSPAAMLLLLRN